MMLITDSVWVLRSQALPHPEVLTEWLGNLGQQRVRPCRWDPVPGRMASSAGDGEPTVMMHPHFRARPETLSLEAVQQGRKGTQESWVWT